MILTNKATKAGQSVVEVKAHGTSIECSRCGHKVKKTLAAKTA
ncbi:zinc ribbon domain-containing protein [Okeania sp. SIO2B3]